MTGDTRPLGRFLGRPDGVEPGHVPKPEASRGPGPAGPRLQGRSRAGRLWLMQALTGALLLLFLAVHLVAQHLLAPGGLRDHAAVVAYLSQPVALVAEIGLLVAVIVHACLGMRASLVEVLGETALGRASRVLAVAGVVATAYGLWLTYAILT